MARRATTPPREGFSRGQLFSALTGRPEGGVSASGSLRDKLDAAYGRNARGGIDTRSAAKDLGVSQRTVQRWIAGEGKQRIAAPRPSVAKALDTKARQSASTKGGRARAVAAFRSSAAGRSMAKKGGVITVSANQGPGKGPGYQRWRTVDIPTSLFDGSNQMDALWGAYEAGGDAAARAVIADLAQDYCAGWEFGEVGSIDIRSR